MDPLLNTTTPPPQFLESATRDLTSQNPKGPSLFTNQPAAALSFSYSLAHREAWSNFSNSISTTPLAYHSSSYSTVPGRCGACYILKHLSQRKRILNFLLKQQHPLSPLGCLSTHDPSDPLEVRIHLFRSLHFRILFFLLYIFTLFDLVLCYCASVQVCTNTNTSTLFSHVFFVSFPTF